MNLQRNEKFLFFIVIKVMEVGNNIFLVMSMLEQARVVNLIKISSLMFLPIPVKISQFEMKV